MAEETKQKLGFWKTFFMVMGIIFTVLLVLIAGGIIAFILINPFNSSSNKNEQASMTNQSSSNPLLSPAQESMLQSLGVDVSQLPTSITPEQEKCAVDALGQTRVNQIINGATPTITDYLKAKDCF